MVRLFLFLFPMMFSAIVFGSSAAMATQQRGDLFADSFYLGYQRPWVPSDRNFSGDFFRTQSYVFDSSRDIFDRRRKTLDYGVNDMFSGRIKPAPYPYQPIFQPPY